MELEVKTHTGAANAAYILVLRIVREHRRAVRVGQDAGGLCILDEHENQAFSIEGLPAAEFAKERLTAGTLISALADVFGGRRRRRRMAILAYTIEHERIHALASFEQIGATEARIACETGVAKWRWKLHYRFDRFLSMG